MKHIKRRTAFYGKRIIVSDLLFGSEKLPGLSRNCRQITHIPSCLENMASVSSLRKLTARRKLEVARLLTRILAIFPLIGQSFAISNNFLFYLCWVTFNYSITWRQLNFFIPHRINDLHIRVDQWGHLIRLRQQTEKKKKGKNNDALNSFVTRGKWIWGRNTTNLIWQRCPDSPSGKKK